jgi:hypothetical protein
MGTLHHLSSGQRIEPLCRLYMDDGRDWTGSTSVDKNKWWGLMLLIMEGLRPDLTPACGGKGGTLWNRKQDFSK